MEHKPVFLAGLIKKELFSIYGEHYNQLVQRYEPFAWKLYCVGSAVKWTV